VAAIFSFGSALGAAQAVAEGLGAKAEDPPEPDPGFREPVGVGEPSLQSGAGGERPVPELLQLLARADRTLATVEALDTTRTRFLGAHLAGDGKAATLQVNTYRSLAELLDAALEELLEAMPRVQYVLSSLP
jgi:hypothetical protein